MFEVCDAKQFIYFPPSLYGNVIYTSDDLYKILERTDGRLTSVFAVLEMPNGLTLFYMDYTNSGEPMIMDRFMHLDSFKGFTSDRETIEL